MTEWKSGPRRDRPCRGCAALREERDRLRARISCLRKDLRDAATLLATATSKEAQIVRDWASATADSLDPPKNVDTPS